MNILNSSAFRFFKNFEKNAEVFYYRTLKGKYSDFKLKLKIRSLLKAKTRTPLSKAQKKEIALFYEKYNIKNISTKWHKFYSDCNGNFALGYIPENLFYVKIEPAFNMTSFFPALADKNLIESFFPDVKQPETVIKNSNGFYFHNSKLIAFEKAVEYCNTAGKMVIKPTIDTWGGNNVLLFSGQNVDNISSIESITNLFRNYGKNFIVQKAVEQHPELSALNSTSLNTFRVMTFLKATDISVLSIVVRMGKKGAFTDNSSRGGISCGLKSDGSLNSMGFDLSGNSLTTTDCGLALNSIRLPYVDKIIDTVKKLHLSMPYFRIISWDLALDVKGDVVLIEHNVLGQGINIHQLNNGPVLAPLAKEYGKITNS